MQFLHCFYCLQAKKTKIPILWPRSMSGLALLKVTALSSHLNCSSFGPRNRWEGLAAKNPKASGRGAWGDWHFVREFLNVVAIVPPYGRLTLPYSGVVPIDYRQSRSTSGPICVRNPHCGGTSLRIARPRARRGLCFLVSLDGMI